MLVGLGTGSTAAFAIGRLGELVRGGLEDLRGRHLRRATIRWRGWRHHAGRFRRRVDLGRSRPIDGRTRSMARLFAIKGAGGAMLREKIVAVASRRMIVIADASVRVERIRGAKLPVEGAAVRLGLRRDSAGRSGAARGRCRAERIRSGAGIIIDGFFRVNGPDPAAWLRGFPRSPRPRAWPFPRRGGLRLYRRGRPCDPARQ